MEEEIKKIVNEELKSINLFVDNVTYKKEGSNNILLIVIDKDGIVNLDNCVDATHIINKVLDKKDFIKESYILDVCSKQKGDDYNG